MIAYNEYNILYFSGRSRENDMLLVTTLVQEMVKIEELPTEWTIKCLSHLTFLEFQHLILLQCFFQSVCPLQKGRGIIYKAVDGRRYASFLAPPEYFAVVIPNETLHLIYEL